MVVRTLHDDLREPEEDDVIMCDVELRENTTITVRIPEKPLTRGTRKGAQDSMLIIVRTVIRMHVVVKLHRSRNVN